MQRKLLDLVLLLRCSCLRLEEIYDFLLLLVPLRNLPEHKSPKSSAYKYMYIQMIQLKTQVLLFGGREDSPPNLLSFKKCPSKVAIKSTFVLLCYLYCIGRRPENWQQTFLHVLYLRNTSMPRILICGFTAEILRFLGIGGEKIVSFLCQRTYCHTSTMANNKHFSGV